MESVNIQPHIAIGPSQTRSVVIVVGDPARASLFASLCDSHKEIAYNREYRCFDCTHKNASFLIVSHGVGSAGALICFEELISNGAKVIIRAGTAGSLQPQHIKQGDIILCHSAVREDGASKLLVPLNFPAVTDLDIYKRLKCAAESLKIDVKCGMSLTSDLFYKSELMPNLNEFYAKGGVEMTEMEISTLFVIAKLKNVKAGAICCIDGSPFGWSSGDYDPQGRSCVEGKQRMCQIVLQVAVQLSNEYLA